MRAIRLSVYALAGLLAGAAQGASAAQQRDQPHPPRVIAKAHQPVGTPHKASSFAPHHTNRRVFGAPIQPPILASVKPKKPPPPK